MLVSSVMQTICWSSGGATSSRGNWVSARRSDAASSVQRLPWADACGEMTSKPAAIRAPDSARRVRFRTCPIIASAGRRLPLAFDLADGIYHCVEGQHGRGVARLVVAHRFEHGDVSPFAVLGRLAVLLEHLAHGVAGL